MSEEPEQTIEQPRAWVYTLTDGRPHAEHAAASAAYMDTDPRVVGRVYRPTLYLHHGRTEAAYDFVADPNKGDWLISTDSDLSFNKTAVDTLFDALDPDTRPIVGLVYWSPKRGLTLPHHDMRFSPLEMEHSPVSPVVYEWGPGERDSAWESSYLYRPMPWRHVARQPGGVPFQVGAIGTGFLAIHRRVLEHMMDAFPRPLHWFAFDIIDGVDSGEDLTFCHRARQLGYPVYAVNTPEPTDLLHIKPIYIGRPPADA